MQREALPSIADQLYAELASTQQLGIEPLAQHDAQKYGVKTTVRSLQLHGLLPSLLRAIYR